MEKNSHLEFALDHGLSRQEYKTIVTALGRQPNHTEIGILGAMWSEHCSYKSSKVHLRKLPTTGKQVIQGPGENAGIVDIGDGLCAVFKMESHNHPSYLEPYQGAATGVGGIIRDIFTMGARPLALLDSLRFGDPDLYKTKYIVDGVVSGISDYGNCMGIPTVGGEIYFDSCYNGNPLVNVFCLGITKKDSIFRGYASGVGNPVVYIGSKTGRDGIQGAIMASDNFSDESEQKRPAVQVGDPFTEKLLLEACLELFKTDCVVGIQDMGAAGLTSSSAEMASRSSTGIDLWMDKVPRREENMTPYELMLSESQERMLVILKKGKEETAKSIFKKWQLDFSIIGVVTDTEHLKLYNEDELVADLPVGLITDSAPEYSREIKAPENGNERTDLDGTEKPDIKTAFFKVLGCPTIANKRYVYEQYDYMVGTNTLYEPVNDSAMIRIKGSSKAVAMTVNCNSIYCHLSPFEGAKIAVAESARNIACSGARPLAVTDCLNFGNPEKPEVMWQFSEAVRGIKEACIKLNTPVVSGNVSFYNQTEEKSVYPTPTIGMIGVIDDHKKAVTQWFKNKGDIIVLLGDTYREIDGSQYQKTIYGKTLGSPPKVDLKKESSLISALIESVDGGIISSAHDVSEGGLAAALAECCFSPRGRIGCKVDLQSANELDLTDECLLFSESQSRCIVSLNKANMSKLTEIASKNAVSARPVGIVGGNEITIEGIFSLDVQQVYKIWDNSLEESINNVNA